MGVCFGRCCPIGRFRRTTTGRSKYYDRESLVEFESLVDSSPNYEEPISVITPRERTLVAFRQYAQLIAEQHIVDVEIHNEHMRREEELELEEEAFIEARKEASRVARLATSQQIINPAKLVFRDSTASWPGDEENATFLNSNGDDDMEVFIDETKLRLLTSRTYLPSHSSMLETGSNVSSICGRDWPNNTGSTPPSSIDLEWDEAGIYILPENNGDKNSTPASNDLEWDNDFENPDVTELDLETEQLISEIEKLTSNALHETSHNYR